MYLTILSTRFISAFDMPRAKAGPARFLNLFGSSVVIKGKSGS